MEVLTNLIAAIISQIRMCIKSSYYAAENYTMLYAAYKAEIKYNAQNIKYIQVWMLPRLFFRGEAPGTGSGGLLRWILATSLLPGGPGLAGLHRTARLGYGDLGPWQTSEWRPGALPSRQQSWPGHLPEHAQFIPGLAGPCTAFGLSLIPHTWQGPRVRCFCTLTLTGRLGEAWRRIGFCLISLSHMTGCLQRSLGGRAFHA